MTGTFHARAAGPAERIARELSADERLLWIGRPRQGFLLRPADAFLIPFSLLWCGFAVFWESGVLGSSAPGFLAIWGIPFLLVGLYFVAGRFVTDVILRRGTAYGVTTSRVIIVSGLLSQSVRSIQLRTLSDLSLTERSDRTGNVLLGPAPTASLLSNSGWLGSGQYEPPTLEGIPEARTVYDLIRRTQGGAP